MLATGYIYSVKKLRRTRRQRVVRKRESGQAVVELALLLPIFLILTLIAADAGRAMLSYITVANAAREAVWYISMHPTDTSGSVQAAKNEAGSLPITVNVTRATGNGAIATAQVTTSFTPL